MVKVLFVCTGNICRSPTAEGMFRNLVEGENLADLINVESAGTGTWHLGEPPDKRSQAAALRRGVDLSEQRSRQVGERDLRDFDYILAMDLGHMAHLERMGQEKTRGHLSLFLDFAPGCPEREVPDPYYGGPDGFEHVLNLIELASQGLLEAIRAKHFS